MATTQSEIELILTDSLQHEGIVTRYIVNLKTSNLILELNSQYDKKIITSPIESDWPKTVATLEKQMKRKGISQNHMTMLTETADNNAEKILNQYLGQEEDSHEEGKDKKSSQLFMQKYHNNDILAEAIIVSSIPKFLVSSNGSIKIFDSINDVTGETIKPLPVISYINKPYSFHSKEQVEEYIEKVKHETLDTLYDKVKKIWIKYVDADDFHISICAADTIFSYYQDILGLTHYLFFVGNNTSGKSNNLHVLHLLAYRNMMSSDLTSANIYQFLGSREEGVGTLCEDEADNIDEDRDKMRIYKNGYTTGFPVLRTDTSFGRHQYKFNTFCFKACAAERLPDSVKAKGFNQRIIELLCEYGFPKYDISEVINPAGEESFEQLLDEMNDARNILFMYRLFHYHEKISDIHLNIANREKQLFKPILRVFQDTETLKELLPIMSKYVGQKRERNANTLHAFLYRLVITLIREQKGVELESGIVWDKIIKVLDGELIKAQTIQTVEFGQLSQKEIAQTLMDVFGATKRKDKSKPRALIFNQDKLDKVGKLYDLDVDIQIIDEDGGERAHRALVGLDEYAFEGQNNIKSQEKREDKQDKKEDKQDKKEQGTIVEAPEAPEAPAFECPYCSQHIPTMDELIAHMDKESEEANKK